MDDEDDMESVKAQELLEMEINRLRAENERLRAALRFYAHGCHAEIVEPLAWDTVHGEPQNFLCDEAGTATIEDGTIARMALRGEDVEDDDPLPPIEGEPNAKHEA